MQITLTVRGTLEEDVTLQEIVSLLYRKNAPAPEEVAPELVIETVPAAAIEEVPVAKPVAPEVVVAEDAPAPATAAPAVSFADVSAAAREALNAHKRAGVEAVFKAHGSALLRDIDEAEYPAVLAEIKVL
ncbi:hypothetical protein [Gordonibacter sp.]|uniref:hypothetical protein n=1 Tax=Gordonibacter sp. TaxID=1968902 RepID=UPI002FC9CC2B